ncbi:MAG TPA: TonB-dependent receptor [Candidatus Eisenbacteria bacterium]|jgi:iron complex outermembrane receptor protein
MDLDRRRARSGALASLALLALCVAACPAGAAEDEAFRLLSDEPVVTGAAKRPQPLSETPSSVTVLTAAEIRAHGFHSLAEALRWVRGLYVTYDRNYSYLGVRGLLRPGDYNNKVLLAVDGHPMNGAVYGDAPFGTELGLDLETVERIEVVRGPGSALYGSNAVLAVVNVVTRPPSQSPGLEVSGRVGSGNERRGYAALAGSRPGHPEWILSGSWLDTRGRNFYFPEYAPSFASSGAAFRLDGERAAGFFGAVEWKETRLAVRLNRRDKGVPTGSFGSDFGDRRNRTKDEYDWVEVSGSRKPAASLELHARAYWDGPRYRGDYVYQSVVNRDLGYADTYGSEWRAHWSPGGPQVVTAGLEGRWHVRRVQRNYDVDPYRVYVDRDAPGVESALYLQDEARLSHRLRVTAGARVDHDPRFDPVLSPRIDLVWRGSEATSGKLLLGSAFRAPTVYETDYAAQDQIGNPALLPERVRSAEGSLVHSRGPLTATLCAYANRVRDLIDLTRVDTLGTLQFRNRGEVMGAGIEGELDLVTAAGTRARLDLVWQESRETRTHTELTNSPRWNGHLLVSHAAPGRPLGSAFGVRWLSPRRTLSGALTPPAVVTDARVQWRAGARATAALEVRNLLDSRYGDPASGEHTEDAILQDSRSFYFTLTLLPKGAR